MVSWREAGASTGEVTVPRAVIPAGGPYWIPHDCPSQGYEMWELRSGPTTEFELILHLLRNELVLQSLDTGVLFSQGLHEEPISLILI